MEYPDNYSIHMDKGYNGAQKIVRAIISRKNTPSQQLGQSDLSYNERVSLDKFLV